MHFGVSNPGGPFSSASAQEEHKFVSDEGASSVILALAKTADGVLGVRLRLRIVAQDIQECSLARRTRFLALTDDLKPSAKPFAGHLAGQLAGRTKRSTLGLSLSFPRPDVVTQFLHRRPRLWHLVRLCLPEGEAGRRQQKNDSAER